MEPKNPIIIDGVDVSTCDYFCLTEKQECYANNNDCNKSPNCYFKQQARKEYECQRTEQKLILIRDFITDAQVHSKASSVCDKILQIIDEVK